MQALPEKRGKEKMKDGEHLKKAIILLQESRMQAIEEYKCFKTILDVHKKKS